MKILHLLILLSIGATTMCQDTTLVFNHPKVKIQTLYYASPTIVGYEELVLDPTKLYSGTESYKQYNNCENILPSGDSSSYAMATIETGFYAANEVLNCGTTSLRIVGFDGQLLCQKSGKVAGLSNGKCEARIKEQLSNHFAECLADDLYTKPHTIYRQLYYPVSADLSLFEPLDPKTDTFMVLQRTFERYNTGIYRDSLEQLLNNSSAEVIEGIYESIVLTDSLTTVLPRNCYSVGIIKLDEEYQIIIVDSQSDIWSEGELRGTFEKYKMDRPFSVNMCKSRGQFCYAKAYFDGNQLTLKFRLRGRDCISKFTKI